MRRVTLIYYLVQSVGISVPWKRRREIVTENRRRVNFSVLLAVLHRVYLSLNLLEG
jgi:hypothetical protein